LDSKNIPGFDTERFEGRLEFPLSQGILRIMASVFFVIFLFLFFRIFNLQIIQGDYFQKRSANNFLKSVRIAPIRGEIYDRNGELLVWNEPTVENAISQNYSGLNLIENGSSRISPASSSQESVSAKVSNSVDPELAFERKYKSQSGLSLLLGFLGFETEGLDKANNSQFKIGKDGIEKYYNNELKGKPGLRIIEIDSSGNLISENVREKPEAGKKIILSVDAKVNAKFYEILKNISEERGFNGGAGVIMDARNGEILAMTNFPEYDSEILSRGEPRDIINSYLGDSRKPFLNRAASGLYAPGSVIKPLIALAALNENIISPEKIIMTRGSISVPNPYVPGEYAIFKDWKNHGAVDMRRALAVSSDVYFYTIGGGYGNIKGLGVSLIDKYFEMFNFGKITGIGLFNEEKGVIPSPELKEKTSPEDPIWRIGDTYHLSIGQGDFQATPFQMAIFASALANKGKILKPRILKTDLAEIPSVQEIEIPKEYFKIVQEGMRAAVTEGTASALGNLSVKIAGKTGTAEIGKKYVNSWFIGFWPYENPRYSITIVLERGPSYNLVGGVSAAHQLLNWMILNAPEYVL